MTCEHCSHCRQPASRQEAADLFPRGTHLTHPMHGHVVYWRNDVDRSGERGRGHFVYRPDSQDRELFYVGGGEFQLATVDVHLPRKLAAFLAADTSAAEELAELATATEPHRGGGTRLTLVYSRVYDLARLIYWVRDMGADPAARRAAAQVALRIKEISI